MMLGDTKIWDPVGGDGLANVRGAYVAMGNTRPAARAQVHGLRRRGDPSASVWDWSAGSGFVPETDGQYTKAAELGCDVWCLLFETFGGFSPEVMALLKALTEERQNKLNSSEYDLTTWAARTWMSFSVQKIPSPSRWPPRGRSSTPSASRPRATRAAAEGRRGAGERGGEHEG